ncbi:uncharacterized protein LOC130715347 [Lotus japonicus]|uniref:uncharacterized protein LOC130715347 n=1 Tax=Lotus japonicus TaxID=34305 RepID=UPI00258E667D|nr:uncharacterized protein LOC130715347 [Lotus japonicus]
MDAFTVSQEKFILFHKIDRDVYAIMVMNLFRDPQQSMQVLGMWLWLERVGFRNVVKKVHSLPNLLINEVADETVLCLSVIKDTPNIPLFLDGNAIGNGNEINLLQSLTEKEITLRFFYENRGAATHGVAIMVNDICMRAVSDIMEQAMMRNAADRMAEAHKVLVQTQAWNSNNKFWFGTIGPSTRRVGNLGGGGGAVAEMVAVQRNQSNEVAVPADDRTLFVTFSKGYRVQEWEVREFFTMAYGDCIEALFMQEVQPNEQSLFARIVFKKICTIDMILRGSTKAKFTINGKHVWARKFVPKRTRSFLPGESSSGSGSGI